MLNLQAIDLIFTEEYPLNFYRYYVTRYREHSLVTVAYRHGKWNVFYKSDENKASSMRDLPTPPTLKAVAVALADFDYQPAINYVRKEKIKKL